MASGAHGSRVPFDLRGYQKSPLPDQRQGGGYEVQSANGDRDNPCGGAATVAATSAATVTNDLSTTPTVKFRVRAEAGYAMSAWEECVAP